MSELTTTLEARVRQIDAGFDGRLGVVIHRLGDASPLVYLHGGRHFPSASVIKLSILWTFFEQAERGALNPAEPWTLSVHERAQGSGVLRLLDGGARLTLRDLATLMIVVSDNVATNVLIDRLGLTVISATLDRLGLADTRLQRRMFDFEARERGLDNVTTPTDTAALLLRFARGDGLSDASAACARDILLGQQLNAGLPARLPFGTAVAHKTGGLPGLFHDAGWIEHGGERVVVAAFTDGLANDGDGAAALAAIGEAVWRWLIAPEGRF
ncbi:MAG: serine hydrolase [Chloroflexi bacterium]|nr:serine hydrolase [Chloroflexota bacterium]